eukprot:m.227422 g.227422  ORF g.227422 m.227422 type:complete len:912 (-) comp13871_c0_seq7:219-2954(-)
MEERVVALKERLGRGGNSLSYKELKAIWNEAVSFPTHTSHLCELRDACARSIAKLENISSRRKMVVVLNACGSWVSTRRIEKGKELFFDVLAPLARRLEDKLKLGNQHGTQRDSPPLNVLSLLTQHREIDILLSVYSHEVKKAEESISILIESDNKKSSSRYAIAMRDDVDNDDEDGEEEDEEYSNERKWKGERRPLRDEEVEMLYRVAMVCVQEKLNALARNTLSLVVDDSTNNITKTKGIRVLAYEFLLIGKPSISLHLLANVLPQPIAHFHEKCLCKSLLVRASVEGGKSSSLCITRFEKFLGLFDSAHHSSKVFRQALRECVISLCQHKDGDKLEYVRDLWSFIEESVGGDGREHHDLLQSCQGWMVSAVLKLARINLCVDCAEENIWKDFVATPETINMIWTAMCDCVKNEEYEKGLKLCSLSAKWGMRKKLTPLDMSHWNGMKAWCLLHLDRVNEASSLVDRVLQRSSEPRYMYLQFLTALKLENSKTAKSSLEKLWKTPSSKTFLVGDSKSGFLALAFRDCFDSSNKDVAITALKALVDQDDCPNPVQLLRCLLRLQLSSLSSSQPSHSEQQDIMSILSLALTRVEGNRDREVIDDDLDWFSRMAWNCGVQSAKGDSQSTAFAGTMFLKSFQFDECREVGTTMTATSTSSHSEYLERQCKASLLAAACFMSLTPQEKESRSAVVDRVQKADKCLSLLQSIHQQLTKEGKGPPERDAMLAAILNFEVRLSLGDHNPYTRVKEEILSFSNPAMCLEVLGNICKQHNQHDLAMAILEDAFHVQSDEIDPSLSKLGIFRELVHQYRLRHAPKSLMSITSFFLKQLAQSSHETKAEHQDDLQWVMIQVWNFGVECYSKQERKAAKSLCSFCMELLRHLPTTLQQSYSTTMANSFASIITKRSYRVTAEE